MVQRIEGMLSLMLSLPVTGGGIKLIIAKIMVMVKVLRVLLLLWATGRGVEKE